MTIDLLSFSICLKGPHDSEADESEKRGVESKPKVAFDSDRKELVEAEPDVMDNPNGLASQNGLDVDVKDYRYIVEYHLLIQKDTCIIQNTQDKTCVIAHILTI